MPNVALAQYATALRRTRYTVRPISAALARPLVERYHYADKWQARHAVHKRIPGGIYRGSNWLCEGRWPERIVLSASS